MADGHPRKGRPAIADGHPRAAGGASATAGESPPLTVGTAGHIDHGKTALVRALTGRDTDRLPEERARGISIALGYALLELPSGRRLSLVDVPGHERFVRTMVAGASGIDLFLLCIASDDGVMPQTREHLAVLRQLGVDAGVVAITKADAGEPELAREEAAELLPDTPIVVVSALARTGLDELREALDAVAAGLPGRARGPGPPRLHVDRSFTLRGIGTVVTGTLWSGAIRAGDSVTILPAGRSARVRSVQVHDRPVDSAAAGQRVALNVAGVGWRDVGRGDVVTSADADLRPSYLLDTSMTVERAARAVRSGARVHVHHGTREAPARIVALDGAALRPGERAFAQLRLEAPLVAAPGDRFVLRQVAPPDTIGGGQILDARPRKHRGSPQIVERLAALERGERPPARHEKPGSAGDGAAPSAPEALDEAALALLSQLRSDGAAPRADAELAAAANLTPAAADERFRRLERVGQAVRVARNLHFHPEPLAELEARAIAICERDGSASIASVRDELSTSRKYAQALLEHLDRTKVTRRDGDVHVLRRRRT